MANYTKSFNFRSGVQVDNDRFLVDGRGNVGVGTSAPNRPLDVYGKARVNDQLETKDFQVSGVSTFQGMVSVGASIFANSETGIISATSYRGDGTLLGGVIAIATNGWVVNSGTLSTDFNAYIGPFPPGEGLDHLPVAEGTFQVGKGSSTFTVQPTGLIGLGTTLPTERLDVRGNALISGISTVQGNANVVGNLTVDSNLTVTGTSTFDNNVSYTADIDVDGVTNLDELSVTGVSTFTADANFDDINVSSGSTIAIGTDLTISRNEFKYTGAGDYTIHVDDLLFKGDNNRTIAIFNEGQVRLNALGTTQLNVNSSNVTSYVKIISPSSEVTNNIAVGGKVITGQIDLTGDTGVYGDVNRILIDGDFKLFGTDTFNWISTDEKPLKIGVEVEDGGPTIRALFSLIDVVPENDVYYNNNSYVALGFGTAGTKLTTTDYGVSISGISSATRVVANQFSSSGIGTFNDIKTTQLGIGTDNFTSNFILKKDGTTTADFVSTQGNVVLSLGRDERGGNNSATIQYNPSSEALNVSNVGSGDVTFRTHTGTGAVSGVTTGGFLFRTGQTDAFLAHLTYDGKLAINQEVDNDLESDFNLVTNGSVLTKGNTKINQNLSVTGIATVNGLVVETPATFNPGQNFHTTSGITTFSYLKSHDIFCASGISTFVGVSTFFGEVYFGDQFEGQESYGATGNGAVHFYQDIRTFGSQIGISSTPFYYNYFSNYGTTSGYVERLVDPRNQDLVGSYQVDPTKDVPAFGYGDIQIKTGGMSIICEDYINIHPSIAQSTTGQWPGLTEAENLGMGLEYVDVEDLAMIGINTMFTRSIVDVGFAVTSMNSYIIVPRLNTGDIETVSKLWDPAEASTWTGHERSKISSPDGLVSGGILFDIEKNQLKVATDSKTFSGIATFTNNGSGHESFVPPTVTDAERTTLTNAGIPEGSVVYNKDTDTLQQYDGSAWSSLVKQTGIGTQATISVVGSEITFTVAGVGSTTLSLV